MLNLDVLNMTVVVEVLLSSVELVERLERSGLVSEDVSFEPVRQSLGGVVLDECTGRYAEDLVWLERLISSLSISVKLALTELLECSLLSFRQEQEDEAKGDDI